MKRCKKCNVVPERITEREFFEAKCFIICPVCHQSVTEYGFWCLDAQEKARQKWDELNEE